jgi:hypothetical protein
MEHLLHLAAGHVLSHITPVYTEMTCKATNNEENDETSAGGATSDECSPIIATGLQKLLGLIKQVCIICHLCKHSVYHTSEFERGYRTKPRYGDLDPGRGDRGAQNEGSEDQSVISRPKVERPKA